MLKYKLITNFSKKTVYGLISFGNVVHLKMTDNANFPNPTPPLSTLRTVVDTLTLASARVGVGGKEGTALISNAREAVEAVLKSTASYVQENGKNDPAILLSSGFELAKGKSPVGPMQMPENLRADCIKGSPGSVKMSVDTVPKALGYTWEYTEFPFDDASVWQSVFSTAATITLALKPRTEYVFCVAAVGTDPTKTFSEKLTFFVV